jgi:putative ABC transport system substrate-binding protein
MNTRRELLLAFGAAALAAPLASFAQQRGTVHRIGFLYYGSRDSAVQTGRYDAFLEGMREKGYVEGKDFVIEARFADGKVERLPGQAAELARLQVDVIVATSNPAIEAAWRATKSIPIVATVGADPVGAGIAANLAHPGGMVTGLYISSDELVPKHMELMAAIAPRMSRVAVLSNPSNPVHAGRVKAVQAIAQKSGLKVSAVTASTPEDIERAFSAMARDRAGAVLVLGDTFFVQQTRQISDLALKHRLPSIFTSHDFVEAGGLMSYGENPTDNFRSAAGYVDKILKGAKPGDLPFERSTRIHLTINRKTARAIGLAIPQDLLLRADKVIE